MAAPSSHHQAPLGVQTHAQSAMSMFPELVVPGFEQSSQVGPLDTCSGMQRFYSYRLIVYRYLRWLPSHWVRNP